MRMIALNIWTVFKPFKYRFLVMLLLVFAMQLAGASNAYFFGKLVDAFNESRGLDEIYRLIALITGVALVSGVVLPFAFDYYEIKHITFNVIGNTIQHVLQGVFRLSIGQHIAENSQRRASIMERGEAALINFSMACVFQILPLVMMLLVYIVWLSLKSFAIAAVVLLSVAVYTASIFHLNISKKKGLKKVSKLMHDDDKLEHEFIRHAPLVLINSAQKKVYEEKSASWSNLLDYSIPFWVDYAKREALQRIINPLMGLVILLIGLHYHSAGRLTTGDLVVCFMWAMAALSRISTVCDLQRSMARQVTDISNLIEMISEEPDVVEIDSPIKPKLTGSIEFRDVVFAYKPRLKVKSRYDDDEDETPSPAQEVKLPVLRGVSFKINPGERVAFVGRSGAGKSTIIHALLRAKDPVYGRILVDGWDLKDLDLHHYRSSIGVVEQNVQLFDKSLRYNLVFGCNGNTQSITDERLDEVCKAAGVSRFFDRLDHGYDTLLGERGVKLSGGQCQRVGIARALIKDPAILILDEATNSLDAENEMLIREAIEASGHNRTTLIIAHRLNTIKNCDKIIVVDDGLVADTGKHDELMSRCEVYQTLVRNQLM